MRLYPQNQEMVGSWPTPIEQLYQSLGGETQTSLAAKLPHLSESAIFFLTAQLKTPCKQRPWGIVTWAADVFGLSRSALYVLADRVMSALNQEDENRGQLSSSTRPEALLEVSESRVCRTILQASLVGVIYFAYWTQTSWKNSN